ncbi:MAG: FhaA domain-containing protein, partial [Corynebacterium casei]
MELLEKLARLDSAMQRGLDNGMAFVFGGKVVPAEIEELLKQEAHDNVVRGDDELLYCPNVYSVGVSSKDLENLSRNRSVPADLADQISRFIRNSGWQLAGPVVVRIGEESSLRTGQLRVSSFITHEPEEEIGFDAIFHDANEDEDTESSDSQAQEDSMTNPDSNYPAEEAATTSFVRQEASQEQAGTHGPAVNLLLQDGSSRTYHVQEGSNIIGRSNDAHLRLPDTGVSR